MRALLIVNPNATSTTSSRRDLIVRALKSALDLEVVQTRYRGEATRLAATAVADKFGLVMTLGGDGTVNEAVNGLLGGTDRLTAPPVLADLPVPADPADPAAQPQTADPAAVTQAGDPTPPADAADLPALAALPGGNANVFVRSLRLPDDPVDAAARLIQDLTAGRERRIGLGWANGRYFTFNAGLGLDAEVVRAVDGMRAHGSSVTPALFARAALRQYFQVTDRRRPAIRICRPSGLSSDGLFLCIVSNSAPWTYLGRRPVHTSPDASFDRGLDLLGFRSLGMTATLRALRQMLADRPKAPRGRSLVSAHDLPDLTLTAERPLAFQLDGEYMGEVEAVSFRSVPRALRVLG
ncbi:MAG: diacylglycerol kinase family lipid kinase [Actinobacteria bacterium]|nr:diacylglycerol kinase family lipid kinase [Actinomycetota bacterium]